MNRQKEANATLYLENAVVLDIRDVSRGGEPSYMVRATVTRSSRAGNVFTNTYALFFTRRPEVEAGWIINASGYLQVKPHLSNGEPRAYVNLQAAQIQSAVPGDESTGMDDEPRPWGSSTRETW
jgi:hypothetical protein